MLPFSSDPFMFTQACIEPRRVSMTSMQVDQLINISWWWFCGLYQSASQLELLTFMTNNGLKILYIYHSVWLFINPPITLSCNSDLLI